MGNIGAISSQKGFDVKTCADRFLVYSSKWPVLKIFNTVSLTGTVPSGNSADFTADASTNYLTSVGHGLNNGDQLNFITDGELPGGLTLLEYNYPWSGEIYYVINKTSDTFQVSLTPGGSAVDITSAGTGTHTWYNDTIKITYTHSLGYLAPCLWIYNGSTSIGQASSYFMSDAAFLPLQIRQYTDKSEVYLINPDGGATVAGDTVYFTLYQFLDNFDAVSASTINTGTGSVTGSEDYGIRVSKTGKDVKTCTDEECILSSSFFTQIIHMKGTANGSVDPITITHNLGYIPSFLSFLKATGTSFLSLAVNFNSVTTTTLESYPNVGDVLYYIIFKAKSV